jgi:hypothetical protein
MNKKILAALIAVTLITPTTAHAAFKANVTTQPATIAILDTALDTGVNVFKDKIAHEVCIIEWSSCPNGKAFMEGPGSATLPYHLISKNGFDHGTQMTSAAIASNPNMKVVFIRIIGNTPTGTRQLVNEKTIFTALDWVIANKEKFNIQAVTMAQGRHDFTRTTGYCFNTPKTAERLNNLITRNVPVFFPTGNNGDVSRIDWPACLDASVSVGSVDQQNEISFFSNHDPLKTDFFALGHMPVFLPGSIASNAAGTSVSVQVAGAQWIAIKQSKPTLTYKQIYDLISSTSIKTYNSKISTGKLINLAGALNG